MSAAELTVEGALAQLCALVTPVSDVEVVDVLAAQGRVLANDIAARLDLPPFDNAAMDGYAVRSVDGSESFAIIGEARAGHGFAGRLDERQAIRIMTGAPLPAGADTIVMLEHAQIAGGQLRVASQPTPWLNVRRRGEHVRRGEVVLHRGRRLSSVDIGLAASVGAARIEVRRRLCVGVLSTGDELVDAPADLPPGAIYDGNRPLLLTLAQAAGHRAVDLGIAPDTSAVLVARIEDAARQGVEVLLTTGGAALGDADVVRQHADLQFIELDFRPGRGIVAGTLSTAAGSLLLLGLPGNAVAAYLMYRLVAAPVLAHAAGSAYAQRRLRLPLAAAARGKMRTEWRRGRFVIRDGRTAVELLADQGSAMLRTVVEADALAAIDAHAELAAGDLVDALLLAGSD
jgi:molybdopterin molybdotransferase